MPAEPESGQTTTRAKPWLWSVIITAGVGVAAAAAYFGAGYADPRVASRAPAAAAQIAKPETVTFYAAMKVRLRDQPSIKAGSVIGQHGRGDIVAGVIIKGITPTETWLRLADNKGFINLVNLRATPPPVLKQRFAQKRLELPAEAKLLDAPGADGVLLERILRGTTVNISGITGNDYLEVLRKQGGTGYITGGAAIILAAQAPDLPPPIIVKIDGNGCAAGPEIDAMFRQIVARQALSLRVVEDAKYPDDDARDAAIARFRARTEGKSNIIPLQRSFRGLTVTGLGVHPESQSIYFADPPEQVRQTFRSAGYRVGRDGKLPSREIYASIDAGNSKVGKTDMGCGV